MRAAFGIGLSLGICLSASLAPAQETGKKGQGVGPKLIGTYKLVSGSNGGKDIPKDHLDGQVRIAKDVMTTYDADHKEVYVVRYNIDREGEPARIAMTVTGSSNPGSVGMKGRGLVKVEGKKLTLIYDYKSEEFPSDFEPKGDSQNRLVMERIEEKK